MVDDRTPRWGNTDRRLHRPAVRLTAIFFILAMLVFVSPVFTKASYPGKFIPRGGSGNELCGMTVTEAFQTPSGPRDSYADRKVACAAKARSRVGYGVLLLLLALWPAATALLTPMPKQPLYFPPDR